MSLRRALARRVAFAVFAAYLVVSVVFGIVTVAPTTNTGWIKWVNIGTDADTAGQVAAYREARNLDEPLLDRYVNWLVDVTTLDWGQAYGGVGPQAYGTGYEAGTEVTSLVGAALPYTLWYVLPAMVIAVVGGIAIGLYTATHQHTLFDRLGTSATYLGFSLPNFWIAQMVLLFGFGAIGSVVDLSARSSEVLTLVVFPTLILTTSLLAGQMRYARGQSLEYLNTEFVKLVRAKGASGWHVARHLLRNAALPLFSLFFTEMLGIVVLNVFVIEYVFGIPGLGGVSLFAYQEQDLPVILGTTMVIVLFGVLGNLLQDIAYLALDPRVEE